MNVLYTLDQGFETQFLVSIRSLIEHTSVNLNVFIIYDGITLKKIQQLKNFETSRVRIEILKAPQIPSKLIPDRGAKNQYYRLYIPEIFKNYKNIKKILYLDADTLVADRKIEQLTKIDLKGFSIAATIDPWATAYKGIFNLAKDVNMFNAGIFIVDITAWNKLNMSEKRDELIKNRQSFIQADQGILNELIHGYFKYLDPKYNVVSSYFEMNYDELICYRKPCFFYSKDKIQKAVKNPAIVHFTSTFLGNRPWQDGSKHVFKRKWIRECMLLGLNIEKTPLSVKQKSLKLIFNLFPRKISIHIFGFLQASVRPFFLKLKLLIGG